MSSFRFIMLIIGIYLAYRFIFHFLIPVYRASKKMHQQFKGMQDQMNQNTQGQPNGFRRETVNDPKAGDQKVNKDYIDFEEIK